MTIDLELDVDNDDLKYDKGRLATVVGSALKLQRIRNRVLAVKGEWFLDLDYGLDYRGKVWNKQTPRAVLGAHIRQTILAAADPGDEVSEFEFTYDGATRTLDVKATVTSAGEELVLVI